MLHFAHWSRVNDELLSLVEKVPSVAQHLVKNTDTGGAISALDTRNLPKLRHKTFTFSRENREVKALAVRSNNRTKSVLEKLVREPTLGKGFASA